MHGRSFARHARRWWGILATTAVLIGLSACSPGGGGTTVCTTSGQGTLQVTVNAAGGVTPDVLVTGPGSFQTTLNASQSLPTLAAGTYVVETLRVAQAASGGALVGSAYGADSQPVVSACVRDAQTTTVTRTYGKQSGSQRLWAGNEIGGAVVGFSAAALAAGGTQPAAAVLDLTGSTLNTTYGFQLAFGPHGDLWVSDRNGDPNAAGQLLVFDQAELASSGQPTPDVIVRAAAFDGPSQLAFDAAGDLYLLNRDANQILEYTAAQVRQLLLDGGTVTTAPAYTYTGSVLVDPVAMAFDHLGNLWVVVDDSAVATGDVQLVRYDAKSLGAGGPIAPAYRIRGTSASEIIGYTGLAFGASGDLWVVGGGTYRYAESDLNGSGTTTSVTPTTISASAMGGGPAADADAIDVDGNVWVSGDQGRLGRYLLASSAVQANWLTSGDLTYPMGVAFYPSPLAGTVPLR